jgi:hypothetical protein
MGDTHGAFAAKIEGLSNRRSIRQRVPLCNWIIMLQRNASDRGFGRGRVSRLLFCEMLVPHHQIAANL